MKNYITLLLFFISINSFSQNFTRKDSLHGGMRFERSCFDVQKYNLDIKVLPRTKKIIGANEIVFKVIENTTKIQLDLFENMQIDSIVWQNKILNYKRDFDAVFIEFPSKLEINSTQSIVFYYQGKPIIAKNAPWDGGFVFSKDKNGNYFIAVAAQGTGASLWYPCKDSQTDEPDNGASIQVAVPNGLMNVSNGKFIGSEPLSNNFTKWKWEVVNPINTYNITLNIGDYVNFHEKIENLEVDYYVLRENQEKAKSHFDADVKPMLTCFQSKFGTYPFEEDGYKLVETPFLGMEHQSAVAYGNKYKKGYLGSDLSGTGEGLFFDFIVIHETAHEWFGNSITSKDIADMWIHEGFTTYAESVFIECEKGYESAQKYINGQAKNVKNKKPIIGFFGVNNKGTSDMYYKGALLLNTLRHILNDDSKWWKILLNFSEKHKKSIIETQDVLDFFSNEFNQDLSPIFEQYLEKIAIPKLVIEVSKNNFKYKWKTETDGFNMPIEITLKEENIRLYPNQKFQTFKSKKLKRDDIQIATNKFYIAVELIQN